MPFKLLQVEYTTPSGQTDLHTGREGIYPSGFGYAVTKGAPYRHQLHLWVRRSLQFGLYSKWLEDAKRFIGEHKRSLRAAGRAVNEYKVEEEVVLSALSLYTLQGPFMVLGIGIAVSLVSAAVETSCGAKRIVLSRGGSIA